MLHKRLFTSLKLFILGLLLITVTAPEWPAFQDRRFQLDTILGQQYFDFFVWEVDALLLKGQAALAGGQGYLEEETRKQLVLDYLRLIGEVRRTDSEINAIFANPEVDDPLAATRELQQQADQKRVEIKRIQAMAEAIIQEQVAAILVDEGFDLLGLTWPPVQMHMTPLPFILVISPREEIRQIYNISLQHGLTVANREEIESAIYDRLDLSALVVPIGGVGFYPAMIVETSNINFLADIVAHEWAHHWLTLHPLGLSYAANPAMRTINETVASIVGTEVGARVIERFYPEFVSPVMTPESTDQIAIPADPPPFNPNAEMAETRIQVDELLAEGKVEDAELYMEQRRQFLWENGYRLRKLNQAYFALYGAYADVPGEQGADPIGPTLLTMREKSASLRDFMDRVASVTSFDKLVLVAGGE